MQQVHQFLTSFDDPIEPEVLKLIVKPAIFSFNHYHLDDSYPKRLGRISKNLSLRYRKQYWAFCYELKDALLDYVNNHHKFSKDNDLNWNPQLPEGSPVDMNMFLARMKHNMVEYNKLADNGKTILVWRRND